MAATQSAYRKPAQSTSKNSAGDSPFGLLEKAKSSNLHPRRRMVLVAMLEIGNRFALVDSPNQIYAATLTVAVELGLPYITVRRALDALEAKDRVLKLVYPENCCGLCWAEVPHKNHIFRRTRTYQVNEEKLVPRMTVREHRARRFGDIAKRHRSRHSSHVTPITTASSSSTPAPAQAANAKTQSVPPPIVLPAVTKDSAAKQPARTRRDCKNVLERMLKLMLPQVEQDPNNGGNITNYICELSDRLREISPEHSHALHSMARSLSDHKRDQLPPITQTENDLVAMEQSLLAALARATDGDVLDSISREAAEECHRALPHLTSDQRETETRKFASRMLLHHWKAPRLSLFYMPPSMGRTTAPSRAEAFRRACEAMHFTPQSVIEGMKYWGFVEITFEGAEEIT